MFLGLKEVGLPLARQVLCFALAGPLWAKIFGGWRADEARHDSTPSRSFFQRLWRFLVSDISYLAFYVIAGAIAFPHVKAFYASWTLPSLGELATLQLVIRGPLFVCLCFLLLRMLRLERVGGALAVGLIFTALSAIAPLMIPNPLLPDAIRLVHFYEMTSSNFLFGAFVGWAWGKAEPSRRLG